MWILITAALLGFLSLSLNLWQWWAGRRFPLHQRFAPSHISAPAPGVSLLKPIKGTDQNTADCLRSWMAQEYPGPIQVLFGVASADDPACELIERLIAEYPALDVRLVICPESLGANAKISTLIQLQPLIAHDRIVISDADVWVPRDLLTELLPPLADSQVGLVNCFYRLSPANHPASEWESIAVNADFWSQVLQARTLAPLDFALGAVMATTASCLKEIGGFESLKDYLADDYQLGHRIAHAGKRIELCSIVVECRELDRSWQPVWQHQLRWARTIRACQPLAYFFSILNNATLWVGLAILVWALYPGATQPAWRWVGIAALGVIWAVVRLGTALIHRARLADTAASFRRVWMIPLKDLLGVAIWAGAFLGNTVLWRGQRLRIVRGGKLAPTGRQP